MFDLGGVTIFSKNEEKLLSIIKKQPFLTQQEIADQMDLPRSTIANLVSNLVQKNIIKGRAYIINEPADIICIGGMNVDRKYVIQGKTMMHTSNPVSSTHAVGGVGRNIAENLGRLDEQVKLISVAGFDHDFEWIKEQTQSFVDMESVTQLANQSTGAYSAIIDDHGEMQLALADMDIYDQMDLKWIKEHEHLLSSAKMIIIDLNLTKECVEYIISLAKNKDIPLFVIPVSSPKMDRLPRQLEGIHTLIVNLDESETFFNQSASQDSDIADLTEQWIKAGVKQVILTHGSQATFYDNQEGVRERFQPPQVDQVVDVTGAGDSFVAGFIFGQAQGHDYQSSIQLAMTNSYHTIQSELTVRTNLSAEGIMKEKNILF